MQFVDFYRMKISIKKKKKQFFFSPVLRFIMISFLTRIRQNVREGKNGAFYLPARIIQSPEIKYDIYVYRGDSIMNRNKNM